MPEVADSTSPPKKLTLATALTVGGMLAALVMLLAVLPEMRAAFRGESSSVAEAGEIAGSQEAAALAPAGQGDPAASSTQEVPPAGNESVHRAANIPGAKTFDSLPLDDAGVATLHSRARGNPCEVLPSGEPVRLTGFTQFLTNRDLRNPDNPPSTLSSRRHILSVGLDMLPADRRELPTLSRGEILDYLESHYITIQARVHRDPVSGVQFLSHRPIGGLATLPSGPLTEAVSAELAKSLRNYRGVGMFLAADAPPIAAHLRTLVLVNRSERLDEGRLTPAPRYEYLFVHARPKTRRGDSELELNVFGTANDRTVLHWLRDGDSPRSGAQCSLTSYVRFTSFSHAGLYPSGSVVRQSRISARSSYRIEDLSQFVSEQQWGERAFDCLPELLDAIVDGQIRPHDVGEQSTAGSDK